MGPQMTRSDGRSKPRSGRSRFLLPAVTTAGAVLLAATGVTAMAWAATPATYSFATGSGLAFTISTTNGDLTSLRHRGVELAAPGHAAGQFESGWSSAKVTRTVFHQGAQVLFSVVHAPVTQYYFARRGDNTIYMATRIDAAIGEGRFISRLKTSLLPTSPAAATPAAAPAPTAQP